MSYILNLTNTTLTIGHFVEVKPGKYKAVDKFVLESSDLAYAVRAKWVSIHEEVPTELTFAEEINFVESDLIGSETYPADEPAADEAVAEEVPAVEEVKKAPARKAPKAE